MALRLLRHARERARRLYAQVWIDAFAGLFHFVRSGAGTSEYHSGRISRGNSRGRTSGGQQILTRFATRHRVSRAHRQRRERGRLMVFFATELAVGVPALAVERPVAWPKRTRATLANGLEI